MLDPKRFFMPGVRKSPLPLRYPNKDGIRRFLRRYKEVYVCKCLRRFTHIQSNLYEHCFLIVLLFCLLMLHHDLVSVRNSVFRRFEPAARPICSKLHSLFSMITRYVAAIPSAVRKQPSRGLGGASASVAPRSTVRDQPSPFCQNPTLVISSDICRVYDENLWSTKTRKKF